MGFGPEGPLLDARICRLSAWVTPRAAGSRRRVGLRVVTPISPFGHLPLASGGPLESGRRLSSAGGGSGTTHKSPGVPCWRSAEPQASTSTEPQNTSIEDVFAFPDEVGHHEIQTCDQLVQFRHAFWHHTLVVRLLFLLPWLCATIQDGIKCRWCEGGRAVGRLWWALMALRHCLAARASIMAFLPPSSRPQWPPLMH